MVALHHRAVVVFSHIFKRVCQDPNAPEQCDKYIDLNGENNADDIDCTIACATIGRCQMAGIVMVAVIEVMKLAVRPDVDS